MHSESSLANVANISELGAFGLANHADLRPKMRPDVAAESYWQIVAPSASQPGSADQQGIRHLRFDVQPLEMDEPAQLQWSELIQTPTEQMSASSILATAGQQWGLESLAIVCGTLSWPALDQPVSLNVEPESKTFEMSDDLSANFQSLIVEAAHDVRSPLAAASQILSLVSHRLRSHKHADDTELDLLESARHRVHQASHWASSVLLDKHLEMTGYASVKKRFYPQQWKDLVAPMLDAMAEQEHVRLLWIGWDRSLPLLYTDAIHLSRVVVNLVSNAIRASRLGGQVAIRVSSVHENSRRLVLHIDDQGQGLEPEILRELNSEFGFERDDQSAKSPLWKGVGLVTVKKLVRAMGGTLSAQRKSDVGSSVRIAIPVDDVRFALHAWLTDRLVRQSVADGSHQCVAFGIKRTGPATANHAFDENLQRQVSPEALVYRVSQNRWVVFTLDRPGLVRQLMQLADSGVAVKSAGEMRFSPLAEHSLDSIRKNRRVDQLQLAAIADELVSRVMPPSKKAVAQVDDIQAVYHKQYESGLYTCVPSTEPKRRYDEAAAIRPMHRRKLGSSNSPSTGDDGQLSKALSSLSSNWERLQGRLDRAHRAIPSNASAANDELPNGIGVTPTQERRGGKKESA